MNPIENAFAKLKALLRKESARTVDALWCAIGRLIDLITQPTTSTTHTDVSAWDHVKADELLLHDSLRFSDNPLLPHRTG